jgi:1-acyl-sn-glycerol-3-phosphate acyltransferase
VKLKQSIAEVLYSFFQLFYRIIFRIYFRWEVYGLEHVPPEGGAILAVNHSSALDPPLGGTALRRKIWYVGRSSLVKNRFIDFIFFAQHLIPITLGRPDVNATKKIIKMITSGEIVLMFPEGTRSCDGTLGPGREGIGMFVSHARADVLPCYISGSWRALPKGAILPRPRKIRVAYGPLIRYGEFEGVPAGREGFARISGTIMERIAELKEALES